MTDQATNEIADFRTAHEAALFSATHPEHSTRVNELFALTAKHYGSEAIGEHGYIPSRVADKTNAEPSALLGAKTPNAETSAIGPEAAALKAEIIAFRNQHSAALYESGHPEHERRVNELIELTTRLHGDKAANDPVNEFNTKKAAVMEDALRPLKAEEFQVGQLSDFGKSLPAYDEWNGELEAEVRGYLAKGEFNEGDARGVMAAFRDGLAQDFSQEHADANYDKSISFLRHQYGDEGWNSAMEACNRCVAEVGGDNLKQLLRETGLGNDPAIVFAFSRLAERKGYITRKGA